MQTATQRTPMSDTISDTTGAQFTTEHGSTPTPSVDTTAVPLLLKENGKRCRFLTAVNGGGRR